MKRIAWKFAASTAVLGATTFGCMMNGVGTAPAVAFESEGRPQQQAADLFQRAGRAIADNKLAEAVSLLEQAVMISPRDAGYRLLLADAYMKSGRFQSAEATYRDVLAIDPERTRAALGLALMQVANGRQQEAMEQLERLEGSASPADLGLAYALAGSPQRAIDLLEPAARSLGATARVRQNLALAYAFGGDWQRARTIAAQDVSPSELADRMSQWASLAGRTHAPDQVAAMLGVSPMADAGQPVRIALNAAPPTVIAAPRPVALASAEPVALPMPDVPPEAASFESSRDAGAEVPAAVPAPVTAPVGFAAAAPAARPAPVPFAAAPVAVPAPVFVAAAAPAPVRASVPFAAAVPVAVPAPAPVVKPAPAQVAAAQMIPPAQPPVTEAPAAPREFSPPPPVAWAEAQPATINVPAPAPVPAPAAVEAPTADYAELEAPEWGLDDSGSVELPKEEPIVERVPVRVQYAAAVQSLVRPDPIVMPVASRAARSLAPAASRSSRSGPLPGPRSADGRFVVQIGAFSSAANAERAWASYEQKFGLRAEQPVTMTIDHQGRLLHRVAISGFTRRGDATQICGIIRARGGECFVRSNAGDAAIDWAARYSRRA